MTWNGAGIALLIYVAVMLALTFWVVLGPRMTKNRAARRSLLVVAAILAMGAAWSLFIVVTTDYTPIEYIQEIFAPECCEGLR